MNSRDTIRNVTGCPAQCNIEEGLAASWKAVFGRDISQERDMPISYATGAIFAATRENIRLHPKSFYENILTLYKEGSLGRRSESINHLGYALEVMWGRIFSGESVHAGNPAERLAALTAAAVRGQHSGEPVSGWPLADIGDAGGGDYSRVWQIMTTTSSPSIRISWSIWRSASWTGSRSATSPSRTNDIDWSAW